jgi:acyl carrier protein
MTPSAQDIQDRLVAHVSRLTGLPPDEIDVRAPYRRFGLDSVAVVTLLADLETWLGRRFRENPLEEHPTIESLAQYLAEQAPGG